MDDAHSDLWDILRDIAAVLGRYRLYSHANQAFDLAERAQTEPEAVMGFLASNAWWGSSGSMLDIDLSSRESKVMPEAKQDNRRLTELLLTITIYLERQGFGNPTVRQSGDILRSILETDAQSR